MVKDYLFTCLAEECAEIIQAATKCIRFGSNDVNPKSNNSNIKNLNEEFNDVIALVEMLREQGISIKEDPERIRQKKEKVLHYYNTFYLTKGEL